MRIKVPFLRYVLAGIAFLLPSVVFVAVLPFLINAQPVRAKLVKEIGAWTGAEIKVAGSISVESLFSLSVEAQDVEIGQFKDLAPISGMKADRVVARIAWFNLLMGNFNFDKIKVYGAVFKVRADGIRESAALFSDLISGQSENAFAAFHIDDSLIALRNGDRQPYKRLIVKDAVAKTAKSNRRLQTSARLVWKGMPLNLTLSSAFHSAPGARIPFRFRLSSALLNGKFDGEATLTGAPQAEGNLTLSSPTLGKAAEWLEIGIDPGLLGDKVSVSGTLALDESSVSLRSGEILMAGQTAQAAVTLKLVKPLPRLEGSMAFNWLDLQTLAAGQDVGAGISRSATLGAMLETDLRISAKALTWGSLETGPAALTLTSRPERLTAEIAELAFLGGEVRGHVALDRAGAATRATARLSAESVDAAKFLRMVNQRDWLSGAADAKVEAEASWYDPGQITEVLAAHARINFPDGGQMRLDIPRLAKSAVAEADGWGALDFTSAAFESLRFEVALHDGQISFSNVDLAAAGRTVSGRGDIDLAARSLDWRFTVEPQGAPGGEGPSRAGKADARIGSALSIKGPWTRPVIRSGDASSNMTTNGPRRSAVALELSSTRR